MVPAEMVPAEAFGAPAEPGHASAAHAVAPFLFFLEPRIGLNGRWRMRGGTSHPRGLLSTASAIATAAPTRA